MLAVIEVCPGLGVGGFGSIGLLFFLPPFPYFKTGSRVNGRGGVPAYKISESSHALLFFVWIMLLSYEYT